METNKLVAWKIWDERENEIEKIICAIEERFSRINNAIEGLIGTDVNTIKPIVLAINNLCGNNNEVKFPSPEISIAEGKLEDLDDEYIRKVIDTITDLSKIELKNISKIIIPIYIFNINNVLSSGNKNEVLIK